MRARLGLFAAGAVLLAGTLAAGLSGLPPSGRGRSAYADEMVRASAPERNALDAVAAITFDYRGFDTLGEELILFAAIIGVVVLLRRSRDEQAEDRGDGADATPDRRPPETSVAVRTLGAGLAGITVLFGLYLVTHGQLSPGGGFQGGVVLATAPLVVYLSAEAQVFRRIAPRTLVEIGEAAGEGGYSLVGLAGLLAGSAYLQNVVPLGKRGDVLSSGTILVLNLLVGLAVASGVVVVLDRFLEETTQRRLGGRR